MLPLRRSTRTAGGLSFSKADTVTVQTHGHVPISLEGPVLWTHVWSDVVIGASYVVIALALAHFVHQARRDIPFRVVFVAFGLFIVTCGFTHFMGIWTLWEPDYWLAGGVKVVTAAASVSTALAMPFTVPRALSTIRDAKFARQHELEAARAAGLEEQNLILQEERATAEAIAVELELANDDLVGALEAAREARFEAEAAYRSANQFLATISHELRTPLNAIIGYEQLLAEEITGPITDAQRIQLTRIRDSATHLTGIIDELLTLARVEAGRASLHESEVVVQELIGSAVALLEPLAREKGLRLEAQMPEGEVPLRTDAIKFRQVLINVVGNAVKFTHHGSVKVRLDVQDTHVEVVVRDTGIGIPPEHAERVYEPFWQIEQTKTRAYGGVGLGLSVSQRLIELLGGSIRFESNPAGGTTFFVQHPR